MYKRRRRIKFEGAEIPLVPIADLIKMKENTDRPKDAADVYYLRRILKEWENEV